MSPVYSKRGCTTCRRRKKKCGEEKPTCSSCLRLDLICMYVARGQAAETRFRETARLETVPCCSIQSINTVTFRGDTEAVILRSAPKLAAAFFSPVCSAETLDLRVLWQLSFREDVLRNAILAAFSRIRGSSGELGLLDRLAYGRALSLVRESIRSRELTKTESICLQPAILWLGWVESVGIGALTSIHHWRSLCILASQARKNGFWREIPPSVYLLTLEATVIHIALHSMYADEMQPTWKTWQTCRPVEILKAVNPPGPQRMANSPILSGQYTIYGVILEVIVLLRYPEECSSAKERILEMEAEIRHKIDTIDQDFLVSVSWGCSLEQIVAACQTFRLACNSALLCIHVLKESTVDRIDEFDILASEGLGIFLGMPLISTTHGTTTWAVGVLACAIRSQSDFDRLSAYWSAITKRVNPDHFSHIDSLFSKLKKLRAAQAADEEFARNGEMEAGKQLPVGFSLLRREHGVLSEPTTEE